MWMLLGEACDKARCSPSLIVIRVCGSIVRIRYMHRAANEPHAAHAQGERAPTRPGSRLGLLIRIGHCPASAGEILETIPCFGFNRRRAYNSCTTAFSTRAARGSGFRKMTCGAVVHLL